MHVPFGNMQIHYHQFKQEIDKAVSRVLNSGHYILGPELEQFEQAFAKFLGVKHTVGCASGTEAIYLALKALGIGPGNDVLVVAHTAVPTISAISMTGAEPVFVDIDPTTYVMDIAAVEAKITSKTKVIIPVHLYGQMVEMKALMDLSERFGIPILEDVAQATGASYRLSKAGSIGALGAFSFYPSKNLGAFGDGGAVSTNCSDTYQKLLRLRNYGQSKRYYHDEIGINSRLDEMQAAILTAQLPFVIEWNTRRREIAHRYTVGLKGIVTTPVEVEHSPHVYHLYVIQHENRDALQKHLLDKGIQTLIHYPVPAHLQKAYKYRGYKIGDLPHTEKAANRILSLPMFPELSNEQVDKVIHEIREFVRLNPSHTATPNSTIVASPVLPMTQTTTTPIR